MHTRQPACLSDSVVHVYLAYGMLTVLMQAFFCLFFLLSVPAASVHHSQVAQFEHWWTLIAVGFSNFSNLTQCSSSAARPPKWDPLRPAGPIASQRRDLEAVRHRCCRCCCRRCCRRCCCQCHRTLVCTSFGVIYLVKNSAAPSRHHVTVHCTCTSGSGPLLLCCLRIFSMSGTDCIDRLRGTTCDIYLVCV